MTAPCLIKSLLTISGLPGSVAAAVLATLPSELMIARHPRIVSLVAYVAGLGVLGSGMIDE